MKYSFIVPVYNCGDCLEYCVNSLLPVKNAEIILVDDGSSDNSGVLCDQFAQKHKNIKAVHQENSGPSVARNKGIMLSHGEYICFVDSDDFISSDVFETITQIIEKYNVDLIISRMRLYDDSKKIWAGITDVKVDAKKISLKSQDEVLKELLLKKISPSPCRYVIKSSVIKKNNIYFKEFIQHEDTLWYPQLLCNCQSFYFLNDTFYNIRMRQGSRGKLNHEKRRKSIIYILNELNSYAENKTMMQQAFIYQNINVNLNFLMLEYPHMSKEEKKALVKWFKLNNDMLKKIVAEDSLRKKLSKLFGYHRTYIIGAMFTRNKVKIVDKVNEIKGRIGGKDEL